MSEKDINRQVIQHKLDSIERLYNELSEVAYRKELPQEHADALSSHGKYKEKIMKDLEPHFFN